MLPEAGDVCDEDGHETEQADAASHVHHDRHHLEQVRPHRALVLQVQTNRISLATQCH